MTANPLDSASKLRPAGLAGDLSSGAAAGRGASQGVQQWTVGPEQAGQRIDNFLLTRLKGVPKTRIYRMLRTGEVRVNGGRIGSDYRIEQGDVLRIPPLRLPTSMAGSDGGQSQGALQPGLAKSVAARIGVIFEDEFFIAIDKPAGLAVHGGSGVKLGVIEALRQVRQPEAGRELFLELVHRLDRETSGLMLLAKRRSSLTEFHRHLREGQMRKRYIALVWGSWPQDCDRIDAPLHKWVNARGERWVRIQEGGQTAITKVRLLQQLAHVSLGPVSLLQCEPLTGRTHQLRVHLAGQGHPILGDPKYGLHERDAAAGPKGTGLIGRMALHAWSLRLTHPNTGETLTLTAPLGQALQDLLNTLGAKPLR